MNETERQRVKNKAGNPQVRRSVKIKCKALTDISGRRLRSGAKKRKAVKLNHFEGENTNKNAMVSDCYLRKRMPFRQTGMN